MKINKVISNGDTHIYEINQGVSKEELAWLRQTLERQSEEDRALKDALQDLISAIKTEKSGAAKTAAFRLLENIGAGTLANVLGGRALAVIQNIAGV